MTTANKPAVRAFATAMAAVLGIQVASTAMADITPTAVWDCAIAGQELDTVQEGLSISKGNNNSFSNGKLVLAASDNSGASIDLSTLGLAKVSVLVKYSNFATFANKPFMPVFMSVVDSANHEVGAYAKANNASDLYFYWQQNDPASTDMATKTDGGSLPIGPASGYCLFSYNKTTGVRICLGSSPASLTQYEQNTFNFSGPTISKVGIGGAPTFQYNDGWPNLVIEKVAIFVGEYYGASDVADYEFPSEIGMYYSDVSVSTINTDFGEKTEIDVRVADGVTITGDTTFNATKVNFHCEGSFSIAPPANNEADFDFSDVSGRPVVVYSELPTVDGSKFTSNVVPSFVTDATQWTGVIYISSAAVANFTVNTFGNESSVVRLGDITGWLKTSDNVPFTNSVPVELAGTLYLNNGNSANDTYPNRCTVFKKLSGSGTISAGSSAPKVVVVIQDASEFTGNIGLNNKIIVFGDEMPSYTDNNTFEGMTGSIWVMEGASVTAQPASGTWWAVGGIKVAGELRAANLAKFGGGTYITTADTGVFTLTSTGNGDETETDTDYARIAGTGSLKYEGTGWRALSTNNFPTGLTLVNEQAGDLLLSRALEYTVGSLSGTKNIQGNYGSGENSRSLRVLQAKDTEWSGVITYDYYKRFGGLTVAPGASAAGTLTLSGTQTQSAALTVESGAKVNLSGTWVGATTVAGTLGGTGAITGDLALSDGATLKVDDLSDPLAVSGNFSATAGTVAVELPAGTEAGAKFLQVAGEKTTGATFTVSVGGARSNLKVAKTSGGLKVIHSGLRVVLR